MKGGACPLACVVGMSGDKGGDEEEEGGDDRPTGAVRSELVKSLKKRNRLLQRE